jgi:hypothetical protein
LVSHLGLCGALVVVVDRSGSVRPSGSASSLASCSLLPRPQRRQGEGDEADLAHGIDHGRVRAAVRA